MTISELRGGISPAVFGHPVVSNYLERADDLGGYLGHQARSVPLDVAVERALRDELDLGDAEIATFMTWKIGRFLGDRLATVENLERVPVVVAMFARQPLIARAIDAIRKEAARAVA